MAILRPRITDYHGIHISQEELDFAIPYLDEDIPLSVDPFLLWKSPSLQDNSLHLNLIQSFNFLGFLANNDDVESAVNLLVEFSECGEVGLGFSKSRRGAKIGAKAAREIVTLFTSIPALKTNGFSHLEEIQLFVDQISKDRISDITCSILKSFLIDYTISQCQRYTIPTIEVEVLNIFDQKSRRFANEKTELPINPTTNYPILFVPKRWLRKTPWISSEDYKGYFIEKILNKNEDVPDKGEILNFNRHNYGLVQSYIKAKELTSNDCKNDPLFTPIPVLSAKRKFKTINALPTGKTENADKKYEEHMCQLLASLLYPHLDFATEQSRTDSNVIIRDLIFYNNRSVDFLGDIFQDYESRQIVFELKNVRAIETIHINQINRYLTNEFGRFGILVTRNPLPKPMFKNTIDLWSGQRRCILALTDIEIEQMVDLFESKQRNPIDVIKKKYIEFKQACPS